MIPLIGGAESSQLHRDRKQNGGCQGLEGEKNGESVFNGYRVSVEKDKNVLEMDSDVYTTM